MSFSTQIQRILQIIKHLFDPVVKALTEVMEVQEKAMSLGSSGSFCCALDKCRLLPTQPNLSGVGEETSLSLQPFAPLNHRSLSCHLPGCLCRSGKSKGACQALSATRCVWDKGKRRIVATGGSSVEMWGAGLIQLPHSLQPYLPWQQRAQKARRGCSAPWGRRGDWLFRPCLLRASTGKAGGQLTPHHLPSCCPGQLPASPVPTANEQQ